MYTQLEQRRMAEPPINVASLKKMKINGEPIACLTAYDASFSLLVDKAGVDIVLVGDSLGMVIQGHDTTVPVTVDDVIYHCRNVSRGLSRAFLVADMPFMSYSDPNQALENAVRLMQEGGAMMIKLEGGEDQISIVEHLARHDIAVCAHLGLKPQSVHKIGGFRVQGRSENESRKMLKNAISLQNAGADTVLLECVPNELGNSIKEELDIPVIGIGAGPNVDGQRLVLYALLGLSHGATRRVVKTFLVGNDSPIMAIKAYVQAVKNRDYPASDHCFS